MKLTCAFLALTAFVSLSLPAWADPSDAKNIFGKDDRVPMNGRVYPWSAIGKLDLGGWCTATLVDVDLILTAAHCVVDGYGNIRTGLKFMPNYRDGKYKTRVAVTDVWVGTYSPHTDYSHDWAFARLAQPLGKTYGWIDVASIDFSRPDKTRGSVTLAGYSFDFQGGRTAGVHENCEFTRQSPDGVMLHDCDMERGASGGALIMGVGPRKGLRIVAINTREFNDPVTNQPPKAGIAYTDALANIAVPSTSFIGTLREIRAKKR